MVDSEWLPRQSSVLLPISKTSPVARINGSNMDVLPKTIAPILYYLRFPVKGKWNFTISGDGFTPIFNPTGSIDLDWPEISHNEIIEKTISLLGITLRDATLSQFEQFQKVNNKE